MEKRDIATAVLDLLKKPAADEKRAD